jgi:hypothetical protein
MNWIHIYKPSSFVSCSIITFYNIIFEQHPVALMYHFHLQCNLKLLAVSPLFKMTLKSHQLLHISALLGHLQAIVHILNCHTALDHKSVNSMLLHIVHTKMCLFENKNCLFIPRCFPFAIQGTDTQLVRTVIWRGHKHGHHKRKIKWNKERVFILKQTCFNVNNNMQ